MCPFLLLVTLALLSAPETESTTYLEIVKGLSNGLVQLAHFVTTRASPRSHCSSDYTGKSKRLSHFSHVCSLMSRFNTLPSSTLPAAITPAIGTNPTLCLFVCCSSHSDGSPPFPSLRFMTILVTISGHITSFLKLPYV